MTILENPMEICKTFWNPLESYGNPFANLMTLLENPMEILENPMGILRNHMEIFENAMEIIETLLDFIPPAEEIVVEGQVFTKSVEWEFINSKTRKEINKIAIEKMEKHPFTLPASKFAQELDENFGFVLVPYDSENKILYDLSGIPGDNKIVEYLYYDDEEQPSPPEVSCIPKFSPIALSLN